MTSPCPTCGLDPSSVSPADAIVALRSLPRRFRELAAGSGDDPSSEPEASAVSAERRKAAAVAGAGEAAEAIAALAEDLRKVLIEDNAMLTTQEDHATAPRHGGDPPTALDRLARAASAAADLAAAQPAEAWDRTGVRSSGPVRAIDLLREAVHAGVHRLRAAEAE